MAIDAGKVASLVVTDRAYMRPQKKWREKVAGEAGCLLTQVESDVVVPVEFASDKQEYAARTLRPRIQEYLDDFLVRLTPTKISKQSLNMKAEGIDLSDIEKVLDGMDLDRSGGALSHLYRGGTSEAKKVFRSFLKNKYFLDGRDPNSFANVAWVFGQHDHGWTEREVYGKVRYISASGLERKAKPEQYVEKVEMRICASG